MGRGLNMFIVDYQRRKNRKMRMTKYKLYRYDTQIYKDW